MGAHRRARRRPRHRQASAPHRLRQGHTPRRRPGARGHAPRPCHRNVRRPHAGNRRRVPRAVATGLCPRERRPAHVRPLRRGGTDPHRARHRGHPALPAAPRPHRRGRARMAGLGAAPRCRRPEREHRPASPRGAPQGATDGGAVADARRQPGRRRHASPRAPAGDGRPRRRPGGGPARPGARHRVRRRRHHSPLHGPTGRRAARAAVGRTSTSTAAVSASNRRSSVSLAAGSRSASPTRTAAGAPCLSRAWSSRRCGTIATTSSSSTSPPGRPGRTPTSCSATPWGAR